MNRLFSQVFFYDYYAGPLSGIAKGADSSDLFVFRHLAWDNHIILRVFAVSRLIEEKSIIVQAAIDRSSAAGCPIDLYSRAQEKPLGTELVEYVEHGRWEAEMYILTNYINDGAICILDRSAIRSKQQSHWAGLEERHSFEAWFDEFMAVCDCKSKLLSTLPPWEKELVFPDKAP